MRGVRQIEILRYDRYIIIYLQQGSGSSSLLQRHSGALTNRQTRNGYFTRAELGKLDSAGRSPKVSKSNTKTAIAKQHPQQLETIQDFYE